MTADHTIAEPPAPPPPPLAPFLPAPRRSAAEEARTLVAANRVGSLATLSADGAPWASMVTYGALGDGSPVLCVSTLAEHGRNLYGDTRASLVVSADAGDGDPLDVGRVTLAGRAVVPDRWEEAAARAAHVAAVPQAAQLAGFGDFSLWVLRVERVRWVGGYGRMESAEADAYAAAEPDPVEPVATRARDHLNDDHADALLAMARGLAGYTDATSARCEGLDRYGLNLQVQTPRGQAPTRVGFGAPVARAADLRAATVTLARRARRT
jgi:putative heme iron utilization protein